MEKLVTGIHAFQKGYFAENKELFTRLAKHGQSPETLFITCSDSRIAPDRLTQTQPGDMFVIRNAGNMIPTYEQAQLGFSGEAATLEYAVEVLNVRDIIICGHTDCGAVKAMLHPPAKLAELSLVAGWIRQEAHLRELMAERYTFLDGEHLMDAAIAENVLTQLEDVRTYPFVRERIAAGTLSLHAWVYDLAYGGVYAYDPGEQQFLPLARAYAGDRSGA